MIQVAGGCVVADPCAAGKGVVAGHVTEDHTAEDSPLMEALPFKAWPVNPAPVILRRVQTSAMNTSPVVHGIGWRAHAALLRSGGATTPVGGFEAAPYAYADGELIAFADRRSAMHPRIVVVDGASQQVAGRRVHIDGMRAWRSSPLSISDAAALVRGCAVLHRDLLQIGKPQGFAAMLVGRVPEFPLARATDRVRGFARALHEDAFDALHDAALPLLGLGVGLTPSGDDLVGAAMFARRAMVRSRDESLALEAVVARVIDVAQVRTHAIGAALFRDLAMGESFAPLHRLANTLASGSSREHAIDAARAVVAIGHSSGWEMLAGFILGVTRALALQSRMMETT